MLGPYREDADKSQNPQYPALFRSNTTMNLHPLNPFPAAVHETGGHIPARRRQCPNPARIHRFCALTRLLAVILALGLPLMQTAPAVAGEVLEIPSVTTPAASPPRPHVPDLYDTTSPPSSDADTYANSATPSSDVDAYGSAENPAAVTSSRPRHTRVATNSTSYAPDPNVGSISDYQNQSGANGASSYSFGGGANRAEPPHSMAANLILGGILVGMVALEIASAHRHR